MYLEVTLPTLRTQLRNQVALPATLLQELAPESSACRASFNCYDRFLDFAVVYAELRLSDVKNIALVITKFELVAGDSCTSSMTAFIPVVRGKLCEHVRPAVRTLLGMFLSVAVKAGEELKLTQQLIEELCTAAQPLPCDVETWTATLEPLSLGAVELLELAKLPLAITALDDEIKIALTSSTFVSGIAILAKVFALLPMLRQAAEVADKAAAWTLDSMLVSTEVRKAEVVKMQNICKALVDVLEVADSSAEAIARTITEVGHCGTYPSVDDSAATLLPWLTRSLAESCASKANAVLSKSSDGLIIAIQDVLLACLTRLRTNSAVVKNVIEKFANPWNGDEIGKVIQMPEVIKLADVHSIAASVFTLLCRTLTPINSSKKLSSAEIAKISKEMESFKPQVGSVTCLMGITLDDTTDEAMEKKVAYCKAVVAACRSQGITLPVQIKSLLKSIVGEEVA